MSSKNRTRLFCLNKQIKIRKKENINLIYSKWNSATRRLAKKKSEQKKNVRRRTILYLARHCLSFHHLELFSPSFKPQIFPGTSLQHIRLTSCQTKHFFCTKMFFSEFFEIIFFEFFMKKHFSIFFEKTFFFLFFSEKNIFFKQMHLL